MDIDYFVNCVFYPRMDHWGLRGDPMLWTDLENHVRKDSIPETREDFQKQLIALYIQLVGVTPTRGERTSVKKYSATGLSGGVVLADFWLDKAFPELLERYDGYRFYHPKV